MRFDWRDFDGDDSFGSFVISVFSGERTRHFDFGPCAVRGLRKISQFLASPAEAGTSGGFRYPDIRTYNLHRTAGDLRLEVHFEGSSVHEEFVLSHPSVEDGREFLVAYYDT